VRYGASFPVGDWGDTIALRDFAQALDSAGMDYVSLSTHMLSMPLGSLPNEPLHHYVGPYREPCVLFSYLAGLTSRIRFRTAVLILPLYPTALLARLAGDASIVSGGRFELGVGISWNPREYQALGQDIHVRGRRMEEQIALLRRLWTEPHVSFQGRWHALDGVGLNQLPPPIPILIGAGTEERLLRRVARIGDGWIPLADPVEPLQRLRRYLEEEGRDPADFIVSGRLMAGRDGPKEWVERVRRLHAAGIEDMELFPGQGVSGTAAAHRLLEARRVLVEEFGQGGGGL
jgi:probable F420-dependent oxidoreductase